MSAHLPASERALALRQRYGAHFQPFYRGRMRSLFFAFVALAVFLYGLHSLEMSYARIAGGLGELGAMVLRMLPPHPGSASLAGIYAYAMLETLSIALLGTLMAAIVAFPLGFLAARNTTLNRVVQFFARRSFDTLRGVDILIWALIWINVVGLGPFAGVLACWRCLCQTWAALANFFLRPLRRRTTSRSKASCPPAARGLLRCVLASCRSCCPCS